MFPSRASLSPLLLKIFSLHGAVAASAGVALLTCSCLPSRRAKSDNVEHREEKDQYMQQCWRPLHRLSNTDTGRRDQRGNRSSLSKRLLSHVCADKLYDEMLLNSQDAAAHFREEQDIACPSISNLKLIS